MWGAQRHQFLRSTGQVELWRGSQELLAAQHEWSSSAPRSPTLPLNCASLCLCAISACLAGSRTGLEVTWGLEAPWTGCSLLHSSFCSELRDQRPEKSWTSHQHFPFSLSQNHRIIWVGRNHSGSSSPIVWYWGGFKIFPVSCDVSCYLHFILWFEFLSVSFLALMLFLYAHQCCSALVLLSVCSPCPETRVHQQEAHSKPDS